MGNTSEFESPKNKRILIIEDDDSMRELFELAIRKEGFQVDSACDGLQALEKLAKAPPDLVLLDLMLPRYGGYEILKQLQKEGTTQIPIIVVTGRYMDSGMAEMIRQESNVLDFLEKPVKPSSLTALLHRSLKTQPSA